MLRPWQLFRCQLWAGGESLGPAVDSWRDLRHPSIARNANPAKFPHSGRSTPLRDGAREGEDTFLGDFIDVTQTHMFWKHYFTSRQSYIPHQFLVQLPQSPVLASKLNTDPSIISTISKPRFAAPPIIANPLSRATPRDGERPVWWSDRRRSLRRRL